MTGIGRDLKSRKLTHRIIDPYQILQKVGDVPKGLYYHRLFRIFMMSFMCHNFGITFIICLIWSSWMMCKLERT